MMEGFDGVDRREHETDYLKRKASALEHPQALVRRMSVPAEMGTFGVFRGVPQDFNMTFVRVPGERGGELQVFIEWVDAAGDGNRVELPSKVIDAIVRTRANLNKQWRSHIARLNAPERPAFLNGEESRRMR